jgi:hypothetical protein
LLLALAADNAVIVRDIHDEVKSIQVTMEAAQKKLIELGIAADGTAECR